MSFYKIMICALAATITSATTMHAMNNQQEKSLYDYTTFKYVQTIASDVKKILRKHDKEHDMSGYDINHRINHSESGMFLTIAEYGLHSSFSLKTPWGEFNIARVQGTFEKNDYGIQLCTTFSEKQQECIKDIKNYFFSNYSLKAATMTLFVLRTFKDIELEIAILKKPGTISNREAIEAAWGHLEKKQYDELKEQEKKEQAENDGCYYL